MKADHLSTAQACSANGVRFVLMVLGSAMAKVLLQLSRAVAARIEGDAAILHADLLHEMCVLAHSYRACLL